MDDDGDIAPRPVQVGFDDLQRESGRDSGVEGVAASLEHTHADRGRDPMGRGHDPERSVDLGSRGEGIRVDVAHRGAIFGYPIGVLTRPPHAAASGISRRLNGAEHDVDLVPHAACAMASVGSNCAGIRHGPG